nr:molybdopterin molybdotransferase [Candidatus Contendobacter sp.]
MPYSDSRSSERLLTLAEAIAAALQSIQPIGETEAVPLLEAYGRVLAADLLARLDVPPADNSAMDGFALYLADLRSDQPTRLPVVGQALAGHPYAGTVPRGAAVRITTGA